MLDLQADKSWRVRLLIQKSDADNRLSNFAAASTAATEWSSAAAAGISSITLAAAAAAAAAAAVTDNRSVAVTW